MKVKVSIRVKEIIRNYKEINPRNRSLVIITILELTFLLLFT